jgi:hypothetical protein
MQILITLEISQTFGFFTHFDLHGENILLRENQNPETKQLLIHNLDFQFERLPYEPVIIDFGFASIWNENKFIGINEFPQYGMLNFYIPGVDQFKFLSYMYLHFSTRLPKGFKNLNVINTLLEFIIFRFYPEELLKKTPIWNKNDYKDWFYNITYTELAMFNPYQLILFLLQNQSEICKILKLNKTEIPFVVNNRKTKTKNYIINYQLVNECIKKGFCATFSRWNPQNKLSICMFPSKIGKKNNFQNSQSIDEKFLFEFWKKYDKRYKLEEKPTDNTFKDMKLWTSDPNWYKFLCQTYQIMIRIQTNYQTSENILKNFSKYLSLAKWYVTTIAYLNYHNK